LASGATSSAANLDAAERRRVWVVIAAALLAMALPYVWAALITRAGFGYAGLLYNPDDQNVHLAWARQARDGHFFFRDLFTTEGLVNGERPFFTNLFSWLLGLISSTGLPLVMVYHAARLLGAALTLWWFYALCASLTTDRRVRFVALLLAAFGGGAGWLAPLFHQVPLLRDRVFIDRPDLEIFGLSHPMMPEAFTFASAFVFSLNIASMALLTLVYLLTLRACISGRWRTAMGAGLAALLLANIHTYDVLPLNVVMLLWAAWSSPITHNIRRARQLARDDSEPARTTRAADAEAIKEATPASGSRLSWIAPLLVVLFTLPPLGYQALVFARSAEFQIKALTPTPAPPPLDIFLSYGLLMPLALWGVCSGLRDRRFAAARGPLLLMTAWTVVTLIMIYAPVSFARKMIEGVHLPLCFLAACGLADAMSHVPRSAVRRVLAGGVMALMCISSLQFVAWCIGNAQDNNRSRPGLMPPLYLPAGDIAALRFLDALPASQKAGRAVLCLSLLGNYLPRETGMHVFIGHWAETLSYKEQKLPQTIRFYNGRMAADEARAWLRDNHIGYVVSGAYEKQLGALPLSLPVAHAAGGTTVYEVPPS
jgi:hypothetical protein